MHTRILLFITVFGSPLAARLTENCNPVWLYFYGMVTKHDIDILLFKSIATF